jgi:huntingtin interacting protein 1
MLSKSRAADSGIKLEVNEKILDSCTNLMQAIRVLVQKSRLLQAEIVAQGKVGSLY